MNRTPHILIVDDEEIIRNILQKLLHAMGYETMQASSSEQALELIEKDTPELILLDIMMPGSSPIAVIEAVRASKTMQNSGIVMISGTDDLNEIATFIKAGADDFLLKPFNASLFKARINAALERISHQQEIQFLHAAIADGKLKLAECESKGEKFCSQLTHDLNNPLTGIIMAAELMLMDDLPESTVKGLENIIESSDQISAIIKERKKRLLKD